MRIAGQRPVPTSLAKLGQEPAAKVRPLEAPAAAAAAPLTRLDAIARKSLDRNIHELNGKNYVTAGAHQFNSLWTRDFLWSSRGLIAAGHADVVKNQLELLFENMREVDHVLPRTMDSTSPDLRVVLASAHRLVPLIPNELGIGDKLSPQFTDDRGNVAFDGNVLAVLAAFHYSDATGDKAFLAAHRKDLKELLSFYQPYFKDGLLQQPPFSDWQDSVKREGATFYTNMLYVCAASRLAEDPSSGVDPRSLSALRIKIDDTFKDPATGLYRQTQTGPQLGLDGNLLALDLGFVPPSSKEGVALFDALRKSPLWTAPNGPGFVTWPAYPSSEKAALNKFVGIGGYHDTLYWSWLVALAAKVTHQMGHPEEAQAILGRLEKTAAKHDTIDEIYAPKKGLPPKRAWLYASEHPFTWGSAFVVDAVRSVRESPPPAAPSTSP
jgi:hypothetical protein